MPVRYIVSDWNGSIIKDKDEGKLWKYVGMGVLKNNAKNFRLKKSAGLLKTMFKLKGLTKRYKAGEIGFDVIYDVFNEKVLIGLDVKIVHKLVNKYSMEACEKIDTDTINSIIESKKAGKKTGILSTGYKYGIGQILAKSELLQSYHGNPFDHIIANCLITENNESTNPKTSDWWLFENGIITKGFFLAMKSSEDKAEFLKDLFFKEYGFKPEETAYIGDDDSDSMCLFMVGYPIVSLLAGDDKRQKFARDYDARTPTNSYELRNALILD